MSDTAAATPEGGETTWTEGFDETQLGVVQNKGWTGPADMMKAYQHASQFLGKDPSTLLSVPGADATDTDYDVFYDRLGRPKEASGYATAELEGADSDTDAKIAGLAHKLGLTQRQFEGLRASSYDAWGAEATESEADIKAGIAEAKQTLKTDWGAAYEQRDMLAGKAIDYLGLDAETVKNAGMLGGEKGAALMKQLANLGEMISEDRVDGGGGGSFAMTAEQAQAELQSLQMNKEFMGQYLNSDKLDPAHKTAVEKMERLMKIAYPGTQFTVT